jgi:hypothetical protein
VELDRHQILQRQERKQKKPAITGYSRGLGGSTAQRKKKNLENHNFLGKKSHFLPSQHITK